MKYGLTLIALFVCGCLFFSIAFTLPVTISSKVHTDLVWSEEFNYTGLPDSKSWSYDVGDGCNLGCGCGWGNQELQFYTEKNLNNLRVENGNLVVELRKEEDGIYSSGRLHTRGKHHWKNGTIEVRAKTAKGLGTWSAVWMLPTDNAYGHWPKSGEIDIMEQVGYQPDSIWSAAHVEKYNHLNATHKNGGYKIENISDDFHTYKLVWTQDQYEVFVDDNSIFTFLNEESGPQAWPFDQDFYLILNLAYGGNWGGKMGVNPEALPAKMLVDYIRVYQ